MIEPKVMRGLPAVSDLRVKRTRLGRRRTCGRSGAGRKKNNRGLRCGGRLLVVRSAEEPLPPVRKLTGPPLTPCPSPLTIIGARGFRGGFLGNLARHGG